MPYPLRFSYCLVSMGLVLSLYARTVQAQTFSYKELQAAYIYNFAKYIRWPAAKDVFVIGVFSEESEMMEILEIALKGKRIGGREIALKGFTSAEESLACHIVYIPETDSRNLGLLIPAIQDKSILVVTEDDMIRKGAMISFVIEEDKLRFKLKKSALAAVQLVASEGLLKLAIVL